MAVKGVDISTHNGSVDFQALKNAGIGFVIIRCGYGSDYVSQDDDRFSENVRKAETAGMPWGTYLYSYAKNAAMAKSEAQHVLRLLNGKKPAYGVWFDVEDSQIASADVVTTSETFCEAIEAAGLYAGIYASLSWLNGELKSPRLDKYDKWVAQWSASCTYTGAYGIWQYTDSLVIGGKNFDGNWAYKDYPALTQGKKEEPEVAYTYDDWKAHNARHADDVAKQAASEGWGENVMDWAKENGIMAGDPDGRMRPRSTITREEEAQTLKNLLESEAFAAKVREILG